MGTPFSWHPGIPPIPNFWYPNYVITTAAGGSSLTTGQMHFYPVMVSVPHAYQNIGVWVTTAGTSAILRFGIYADTGLGVPGALVYDAGAATAPTTAQGVQQTLNSLTLFPGQYWLSVVRSSASSAATVLCDTSSRNSAVFGQTALAASLAQSSGYVATTGFFAQTGSLPLAAPAALTAELAPFLQIEA